MAEVSKRKVHSAEFKAKVGMEAVRGVKTFNEVGQQYGVHSVVVGQWRKEIVQRERGGMIKGADAVGRQHYPCLRRRTSRPARPARPRPIMDSDDGSGTSNTLTVESTGPPVMPLAYSKVGMAG